MQHKTEIKENVHYKIIGIYLNEISYKEVEKPVLSDNSDDKNINYEISLGTNHYIENNNIFVTIQCNINVQYNQRTIRNIECSYIGHFQFSNEAQSELKTDTFASQNAPAIIYPYLRQFINYLITQAGLPPVILPIIMITPKKDAK